MHRVACQDESRPSQLILRSENLPDSSIRFALPPFSSVWGPKKQSLCAENLLTHLRGLRMEGSGGDDAGRAGAGGEKSVCKAGEVQALLFARAQELAGVSAVALEIQDGWTTATCFAAVMAKYPALESISSCMMVALNHDYVTEPVPVKDGDELALIPPISGG